jgi:hypoxanthine phosphoribosyltransferase
MISEQDIRAKLDEIKQLKRTIETRLLAHARSVRDANGKLLTETNIHLGIKSLADELIAAFPDEDPVMLALTDGAIPFASELNKELAARNYAFKYTTMQVSSYAGMHSGELIIGSEPKIRLGNRVVIVVDDVCDSGHTYAGVKKFCISKGTKDVHLMTLIDKVQERHPDCNPKFSAFKVSKDAFIIGFGLDFNRMLRNERAITSVDKDFLPSPEEQELLNQENPLNDQLIALIAQKDFLPTPEEQVLLNQENPLDVQLTALIAQRNNASSPGTCQDALFVHTRELANLEHKKEYNEFYNTYSLL